MQTNNNIWRRIGKTFTQRQLNPYFDTLNEINRFYVDDWTNEQLQDQSLTLLHKARNEVDPDQLLIHAFAIAREAVWRVKGIRLYDVRVRTVTG